MCLRVLKESNKSRFDSYSVRNSVLIISHITFRDCRVHIFPTTFLEIAVYTAMLSSLIKLCRNPNHVPRSLNDETLSTRSGNETINYETVI